MSPCLCSPAEFGSKGVAGTVSETGMLIGVPIGNMLGMETNARETPLIEEILEDEVLEIEKAFILVDELTKINKTGNIKINKPKNLIANSKRVK